MSEVFTFLDLGSLVNPLPSAQELASWRPSDGFRSCFHAKEFFIQTGLQSSLRDCTYPIVVRSRTAGSTDAAILPVYCTNMLLNATVEPREYLFVSSSSYSSVYVDSVTTNPTRTTVRLIRLLVDELLLDLNVETFPNKTIASTDYVPGDGSWFPLYRSLSDQDSNSRDARNPSGLTFKDTPYQKHLRFSSEIYLHPGGNSPDTRCECSLDSSRQNVTVNVRAGGGLLGLCALNYVDVGSGTCANPGTSIPSDIEVARLDPRLVPADQIPSRRGLRLELIES
jgi:hypothetical protein